jgi:hypothetical protein
MASGFTVHLLIELDLAALSDECPREIFSLVVSDVGRLSCALTDGTVAANLDDGLLTYDVPVIPKLQRGLQHWTFAFVADPTTPGINSWIDKRPAGTAGFANVPFTPTGVSLTVGSNGTCEFARVSRLDIFGFPFTFPHVVSLINHPAKLAGDALFRLQTVPSLSRDATYELRDLTVVVRAPPSLPRPLSQWIDPVTLLHCEADLEVRLGFITLAFRAQPHAQDGFPISELVSELWERPTQLTIALYTALCAVLDDITSPGLRAAWFSAVIASLPLWSLSAFSTLRRVLRHWSHVLPVRFARDCLSLSFSEMAAQYVLFFCDEFSLPSKPFAGYTTAEVDRCCELFRIFLARLAFRESDVTTLATFLDGCSTPATLVRLLRLVQLLPVRGLHLHPFIESTDSSVVVSAILAIQAVYEHEAHVHMLAVAFQFAKQPHVGVIFQQLLVLLPDYPRLVPVVCICALRFGDAPIASAAASLARLTPAAAKAAAAHRTWFVWPLLIALYADPDSGVIDFIGLALTQHPRKFERTLSRIACFLSFLRSVTELDTSIVYAALLKSPHTRASALGPQIAKTVLATTFFQASARTQLVDKARGRVADLRDILQMAELYEGCRGHFGVSYNEQREWTDRSVAAIAAEICESVGDESARILRYFCNPNGFSVEERIAVGAMMSEVLPPMLVDFQARFAADLAKIFSRLKEDFAEMLEVILESPRVPSDATRKLLETASSKCAPPSKSSTSYGLEPDASYCAHFLPVRMRRAARPAPPPPRPQGELILERVGNVVELGRVHRNATLRVYADWVVFPTAAFPTSSVTHIWPRTRRNSAVEFVTATGASYVFDFVTVELAAIVRAFKRAHFENCVLWPTIDLFANSKAQEKWLSGEMSNFDYILFLNYAGGRSFHDASAYPFFPSLLADFGRFELLLSSKPDLRVDPRARIRAAFSEPVVPADFFFRIERIDEVPPWATSAADFVDKMRDLLESPRVSAGLHTWFTKYFGIVGPASNSRLFQESMHPARSLVAPMPSRSHYSELRSRVLACQRSSKTTATLLLRDAGVAVLCFDDGRGLSDRTEAIPAETVIAGGGRIAALYCGEVAAIADGRILWRAPLDGSLIAWVGDELLFCPHACAVTAMSSDGSEREIWKGGARVVAVAGDPAFRLVVVAEAEGGLEFLDLLTLDWLWRVELKEEARLLLLTPNWGYTLALSGESVVVLSVNGTVLKEVVVEGVAQWFAFSAPGDVDWVVFLTDGGEMGQFPAFRPEEAVIFWQADDRPCDVIFMKDAAAFLVVDEAGGVNVVPRPLIN